MTAAATRIGGLCGIATALVVIPAYTVGSPEAPKTPADAHSYHASASSFVTANGTLPLYHFSQIGAAALIFATAIVIWHTGAMPKWSVVLAILGVLPLVHTWIGLPAAYSTIAWIALTGLLMLALPLKVQTESAGA
jgi:hypothetical protein